MSTIPEPDETALVRNLRKLLAKEPRGLTTLSIAAGQGRTFLHDIMRGQVVRPRREKLMMLAQVLNVPIEALTEETPPEPAPPAAAPMLIEPSWDFPTNLGPMMQPPTAIDRSLPLMGEARGSFTGQFEYNEGRPISYTDRPPYLAGNVKAFALIMRGDSMLPRYSEGEILYVNPLKIVRPGDYVVAEITNHRNPPGSPPEAIIKRFARRDSDWITLEQLNPPDSERFRVVDVMRMSRIIGSYEER